MKNLGLHNTVTGLNELGDAKPSFWSSGIPSWLGLLSPARRLGPRLSYHDHIFTGALTIVMKNVKASLAKALTMIIYQWAS
jgi:hypothetical protein